MSPRSVRPPLCRLPSGSASPGMPAVAVQVHLDVRHAELQHRGEVVHRPDRVAAIARGAAGDERRRHVLGNRRRDAVLRERRRPRIDDADEVRPGRHAGQRIGGIGVLRVELGVEHRRRRRQLGARREAHDADLARIDPERRGVRPHQADRLLRIGDGVRGDVVAVLPQAVAQDHRVDAVVVEERHEVGALGADVEGVVAAAGDEDHHRPGVDAAIDGVELDARVVDVDDAADAPRHRLAQVVGLGLAHAIGLQQRRPGRIQRHDDAARHDRLRRIRRGGGRPGAGMPSGAGSGGSAGLPWP